MEVGMVQKIDIDHEMQQAYLDYAMSVIVSRALPDARDGLKPVHRRILYAMYDMGLRAESPYKKSARIVGEVLGKYHPHGDMAVYDAMARMAQDFSMRVLLVDGQGNFGSIDGDPPAAMRYTEARLASAAIHMLTDIGKNTVDFDANFDETLYEPTVLPAAIPNLLVNGASGIAVGMSTSIPPHNLGEVVDALRYMLEHWEAMDDISLEDLMRFVQGPDFPTGGAIIQQAREETLASAYGTGRGRVTVQAQAHLEEMERGRNRIIVNELPYLTNKASLIERIAELVREERLVGIADLRDESDRHGMRIVIELTKTADPQELLKELYKHTPMQSTFSIIMLALVDGEPRLLSLKQALRVYLDHRIEVIRRRSEYDLDKARQRAHILEGLRVALKNLDEVIALIRQAPDADTARVRLMRRFKLTDVQAQAILDMQLRRLASLERKKIEIEYKELQALIKELESLLLSPKKMRQLVSNELQAIKEGFGERRRTQIVMLKAGEKTAPLTAAELAPDQAMWLVVTPEGLASRIPEEKTPRQSGSDAPGWLLKVNSRDTLYLVSEAGEAAAVAMQAVPETDKPASGTHYNKFSALKDQQPLAGIFTLPPKSERPEDWFVLSVTRQAMVKKTSLAELPGPSANSFLLTRINEGDRLGWLRLTNGQREILLQTGNGMAIRFSESEVRPMGLGTAGVSGMKLQPGDLLAGMELVPDSGEIFMLASDGSAKRVAVEQFPAQGRYGQGVVAWKLPAKVHVIGIGAGRGTTRVTLHLEKLAAKMVRMDAAPLQGRSARGKLIQEVRSGDHLLRLVVPWEVEKMSAAKKEKTPAVRKHASSAEKPAPARSPTAKVRAPARKAGAASKSSVPAKKSTPKGKPASPPKSPKPASSRRQGAATGTKKSS
jgi:DNA gyrase subunit A